MYFCVNLTLTFFPNDAQVGVPGQTRFPRRALHLCSGLIGDAAHSNTVVEAATAGPRIRIFEPERDLE